MTQRERNPIGKAFQALAFLATSEKTGASLGEIAEGVGLKPSTIHRVLGMLEEEELIQQDTTRGRYSLGWRFVKLAKDTSSRRSPADLARPFLAQLRDATGETSWFANYRPNENQVVFIESVESNHPMRQVRTLNAPLSIFAAGAAGRLTLALMEPAEQEKLLNSAAAKEASHSFVDPAQIQLIRTRGYAVSISERGGVGIAVPVLDASKRFLGVVGIGLPQVRFDADDEPKLVVWMTEAAQGIARELG